MTIENDLNFFTQEFLRHDIPSWATNLRKTKCSHIAIKVRLMANGNHARLQFYYHIFSSSSSSPLIIFFLHFNLQRLLLKFIKKFSLQHFSLIFLLCLFYNFKDFFLPSVLCINQQQLINELVNMQLNCCRQVSFILNE